MVGKRRLVDQYQYNSVGESATLSSYDWEIVNCNVLTLSTNRQNLGKERRLLARYRQSRITIATRSLVTSVSAEENLELFHATDDFIYDISPFIIRLLSSSALFSCRFLGVGDWSGDMWNVCAEHDHHRCCCCCKGTNST